MDTNRTLSCKLYRDTRTVALLDQFESRNADGTKTYETLLLKDVFCIKYENHLWWVGLQLKRKPQNVECVDSSLTFTKLKKDILEHVFSEATPDSYRIIQAVFSCISLIPNFADIPNVSVQFDKPVKFNAQNSSNRCGYGNRYWRDELVHEGTLYGETTDYMFVGAQFHRW